MLPPSTALGSPGYKAGASLAMLWELTIYLVDLRGVEPRISPCKGDVFPLALEAHLFSI